MWILRTVHVYYGIASINNRITDKPSNLNHVNSPLWPEPCSSTNSSKSQCVARRNRLITIPNLLRRRNPQQHPPQTGPSFHQESRGDPPIHFSTDTDPCGDCIAIDSLDVARHGDCGK